jgi:5-methylcytosine-specific restriction endonuclease McrA
MQKVYSKTYYLKNREKILKYRKDNKEKISKINSLWRSKNKEKIKNYNLKFKAKNKEYFLQYNQKERSILYQKEYRLKNPHIQKSINAKRRALKLKATPKFANLKKIKQIYKNCPKGYEVDHIIPLNSKLICGLHVEWNLQYLTPTENQRKSNKLIKNI